MRFFTTPGKEKGFSLFLWLTGVVAGGLIATNLLDLADVLKGKGGYPFGSEFFGRASLYSAKEIYIFYNSFFTLLLMATLLCLLKKNRRPFYILLTIDGFLLLYPVLVNG